MNDRKKGPGEAEGDGTAEHGYRNEVSWEAGQGRQPYANRGDAEQHADAMPEPEAGNAGETAGRNVEDLDAVKRKPERPESEAPRST
ncbi:hypothetical protein H8N03_13010 [Ramlibacter sp. USB13]|uniref:Uncharacterized protein n=1 Tax=Ramlibacter cellulosilyticus TaxID=2764187 RepID=A0A923MSM4_9BURK|nr:hypothetical protein [Ramlibacter cellulosilyticus]MBC5783869.1 hypothetical protein [Ramlibacter cellulosilyticus]